MPIPWNSKNHPSGPYPIASDVWEGVCVAAFVSTDRGKKEATTPVLLKLGTGQHHPLSEASFEAQLCHERRRAERSGRTIALLAVDCRKCFAPTAQEEFFSALLNTLCEATRLTDIVGWHMEKAIAGVIITELGNSDPVSAVECIQAKIVAALDGVLRTAQSTAPRVKVQFFPEVCMSSENRPVLDLTFYPELSVQRTRKSARDILKRSIDVVGSCLALTLLAPVFAATAAAIRLTSSGPALYRQQRVGQFGVEFTMYKFRTMHLDAASSVHEDYVKQFIGGKARPEENAGVYKLSKDKRVTPLGRFLRKTSLDELPQFFNVLQGSMSLVGPRPPLRYELDVYESWHRRRVLEAKPGLTGLWQVTGRSRTPFDEMVRLDLRYAKNQSLLFDISLLLKTVRVLISDDGAC